MLIVVGWLLFGIFLLSTLLNVFSAPRARTIEEAIRDKPFVVFLGTTLSIWLVWALLKLGQLGV